MHTPKHILITGGAGFIGSNLVRYFLEQDKGFRIINLDALTYAGNLDNLKGLESGHKGHYRFVHGNITDQRLVHQLFEEENLDTVIHLAAESHVDRSIEDPLSFVDTNVRGTVTLLQAASKAWDHRTHVRFHHVSTDEVYGSLEDGLFAEKTPYDPSSPYSASKASADHFVRAWARTYGLPVTISNCSNNYGPYQFPEKVLPLMLMNALAGKALPVYGDGKNVRDWLHVEDHCRAIDCIVHKAKPGTTYNVGGNNECANIDMVGLLCDLLMEMKPLKKGHYRDLIAFVEDRPGHDRRYAMDTSKIQTELGWSPRETIQTGLRKTIQWYLDHHNWVERIYREKYQGERLGLNANRKIL